MNAKENVPKFNRGRGGRGGRGRNFRCLPIQRTAMGPPKHRVRSVSAYTVTSSSSKVNWKSHPATTSVTLPTTSSSRSRSSTEPESRIILALSEGRGEAMCEVGIAAINIAHPTLILCQISDTPSYVNTMTKINIFNPSEILVPLTFIESSSSNRLLEKVKQKFQDVKITGVTRSMFNKNNGLEYVRNLCLPALNSILLVLEHKYYALAAAAALLTYTELRLYINYGNSSVKVEYQESEGFAIIDVATADRLELVASARPTIKRKYSCLLDIMNYCHTKIGTRVLRASILQPPCNVEDIEKRLDCVTELMEHGDMLTAIQPILIKLANIDQLLSLARVLPNQAQNCSERQLNYILILNVLLEETAPLRDIFENSQQPFFVELCATLNDPALQEVKSLVRSIIHTDAHPSGGHYGTIQRCFAIKSGINSLLDAIRKTYSDRLDRLREYVKILGEKYNLPLTLNNTGKRGYHMVMALNAHQKKTMKRTDFSDEFIQVERLPTCFMMKTEELISLSTMVEDVMVEILKMSNITIHNLLSYIREHIGIFYKLCEDIARLDMLQSLAHASNAMQYVRPQFADYMEIVQSRHPLLDFLCTETPVANSIYASQDYNMNIITGPNGSGKSIFIRQALLIQVMAQVGCYVPADSAVLRVADRILARVHLGDNMNCGASAFVLEMKEIQYFLTVITKNTLIIIDELGRSTSLEEGTAIAMAICERLLHTPAFVFFTTHFKLLARLSNLYLNIKTWQLETLTEMVNNEMILQFTYNVVPGIVSLEHYSIFLAKGSWPPRVIKNAEDVLRQLARTRKTSTLQMQEIPAEVRLKYNLEASLRALKAKGQLDNTTLTKKLQQYQRDLLRFGYCLDLTSIGIPNAPDSGLECNHCSQEPNEDDLAALQESLFNLNEQEIQTPTNPNQNLHFNGKSNFFDHRIFNNNNPNAFQPENEAHDHSVSFQESTYNQELSQRLNQIATVSIANNEQNYLEPEVIIRTGSGVEDFDPDEPPEFQAPPNTRMFYENQAEFSQVGSNISIWLSEQDVERSEAAIEGPMVTAAKALDFSVASCTSLTQQQFSLPLQQGIDRTSTPLSAVQRLDYNIKPVLRPSMLSPADYNVHPISYTRNILRPPVLNLINGRNTTSSTSNMRTNSGSIKWTVQHQRPYEVSATISSDPKRCSPIRTNGSESKRTSTGTKDSETKKSSTDSVPWKINTPQNKDKNKTCCSNASVNETQYYSDPEISEAINELQNCSECFFDVQDWDFIDKDVSVKIMDASIGGNHAQTEIENNTSKIDKQEHFVNEIATLEKSTEVDETLNDAQCKSQKLEENFDDQNQLNVTQQSLEPLDNIHLELFSEDDNESNENAENIENFDSNENAENFERNENAENNSEESSQNQNNSPKIDTTKKSPRIVLERLSSNILNKYRRNEDADKIDTSKTCDLQQHKIAKKPKRLGCKIVKKTNLTNIGNVASSGWTASTAYKTLSELCKTPSDSNDKTHNEEEPSKTLSFIPDNPKRKKAPKFKPPCKLTKREIETEFYKQDQKMLESEDSSQYIDQIKNRPSVRQLQESKVIASIHRTSSGIVVLPTTEQKCKPRKRKFVTPLKERSGNIDITIFSDRNVNKFEELMGNNSSSTSGGNNPVRQDLAPLQFIQSAVVSRENPTEDKEVHKEPVKDKSKDNLKGTTKKNSTNQHYYSQNKSKIDNLVEKYLNPRQQRTSKFEDFNSSFFSQSTDLIEDDNEF